MRAKNEKSYYHSLWDWIKNAAKRARKKWNIFRNPWATLMLQNGTDVEKLREMVNWRIAQMPLHYASALNKGKRREKLNEMPVLYGRKLPEIIAPCIPPSADWEGARWSILRRLLGKKQNLLAKFFRKDCLR